jgi:hypothetical protein
MAMRPSDSRTTSRCRRIVARWPRATCLSCSCQRPGSGSGTGIPPIRRSKSRSSSPSFEPTCQYSEAAEVMKKYVVSNSLRSAEWENTEIISGDVANRLAEIKAQDGRDNRHVR